ncbi:hypothetical protein Fmac_006001 [Flemingia macrophylla]|uniref:Uncharacterized protein n=1 Tax=Flemingia macrophylla TaxID=520843 RepID=A0ABD1N9V9_9FABA
MDVTPSFLPHVVYSDEVCVEDASHDERDVNRFFEDGGDHLLSSAPSIVPASASTSPSTPPLPSFDVASASKFADAVVPSTPYYIEEYNLGQTLIKEYAISDDDEKKSPSSIKDEKYKEVKHKTLLCQDQIVTLANYDFVIFDMGHGPGAVSDSIPCLHHFPSLASAVPPTLSSAPPTTARRLLPRPPPRHVPQRHLTMGLGFRSSPTMASATPPRSPPPGASASEIAPSRSLSFCTPLHSPLHALPSRHHPKVPLLHLQFLLPPCSWAASRS